MGPKGRRQFEVPIVPNKTETKEQSEKSINVQPIKIMIASNIPGKKEPIPFTKSILYQPNSSELYKTELNEYPYISDNVSIESIFNDFNTIDYSNVVQFFFDKKTFISKVSSSPNPKFVVDDTDIEEKNEMLEQNFKEMLRLLFPTSVPLTDNINSSYDDYLVKATKLPTVSYKSLMEYFKIYKLSFLNINGKEYTVSSVTWLNDTINHPGYSTLFDKFKEYRAWSKTTTKKLQKKKIELFLSMSKVCETQLKGTEKCQSNGRPPSIKMFNEDGVYRDTYEKASAEIARINEQRGNVVIGEDTNRVGQLEKLKVIISTLANAAWEVSEYRTKDIKCENLSSSENGVDINKVTRIKEIRDTYQDLIKKPYSQLMSEFDTDTKLQMPTIQGSIDHFQIGELKILHDELNKRALFSNKFRDFVSNLSKLYEQSLEIDNIWNRLNNRALYTDKPVPAEYSKITTILKDLNEYESSTRESTNIQFQAIIDDYVAHKEGSDEALASFIGQIVSFKSSKKRLTPDDRFKVGLVRLQNSSEPSSPNFEAFVRVDLLGGVLSADNIGQANCMFYDKKLADNYRNMRNKITIPEWQVRPGNFITLPANAPKATRRMKTKGGSSNKTQKRTIRRK
jgi:hypothetical protein